MNLDGLTVKAKIDNLELLHAFLERRMMDADMPEPQRIRVMIALEEAFVNICRYAYPVQVGEVQLHCGMEKGAFVVELTDYGVPFDLTTLAMPKIDVDLMQRPIGGLGVYCIHRLANEVSYRREDNRNILRISFHRLDVGAK